MKPFEYLSPTTVREALEQTAKLRSRAMVMAGGTDVMVWLNARQANPEHVIDLSKLRDLQFIRQEEGGTRIGALTTFAELIKSETVSKQAAALADAARNSAGPQVRNLATIGGNLGTASPAGDLILALVVLDAKVKVQSLRGERTLSLDQFLIGPKQNCLAKDELIIEIILPPLPAKSGSAFQKMGNRHAMTIAIASAATAVTLSADGKTFTSVRVALGSVAPTVVRAKQFEQALQGKPATVEEIAKARQLVQANISPITDIRGQAWYRREVAGVLAARSVEDALAAALGISSSAGQASKKKGWGVGGTYYSATVPAAPNPYSLNMQMREDGSVVIQAGGCDIGQGSNTVIATIAAEALGVDVEQITVYSADTGMTPYDFGTVSSRQTFAGGNAVLLACEQIKKILIDSAAKKLEVPAESLIVSPGFIRDKDNPEKCLPIAVASTLAHFVFRQLPTGSVTYYPKNAFPDHNMQGEPIASFNYHATVAEVEVDTETGVVEVRKLYPTVDCGKAISPLLVEGQVEGGALQGIGWALREDAHPGISPVGRPSEFNPAFEPKDLANYPIATSMDMPEIHASFVEVPEKNGPYGAKAAGEISAMTAAPAILNAIYDAVGVRMFEVPASPDKVLKALQNKCQVAQKAAGA
ncbi:MAG: molybdopterin cofactor-binding domain-containing protein [Candidatus Korobacteraceae bacterium]